ncbi:allatostatin-A receptor-like [Actinia tenebrosa]|uniref:Allatostatin-A receptor-like n=1 Tax=Actinia tenebrosa TaxID=6105 RepID=A0A6P8IC58_ACTTE|nr:allatostatin-A receptor-like [Actinia tenebrosa]
MNVSNTSKSSSITAAVETSFLLVHAVIILTGVVGNALVIVVVKTTPSMYTTTNFLLVNVAVANLFTVIWLIPADGFSFLAPPGGSASDFLCRFFTYNSLPKLTTAVSGTTFTLIAVERYHAIIKPLRAGRRLTTENVRYVIAGIWFFWCAILVPFVIFIKYDENEQNCTEKWSSTLFKNVLLTVLSVTFITLVGTMVFCYSNLIKNLYFTKSILPESATADSDKKSKRKLIKFLVLITIAYLICFAPYIASFVQYAIFTTYSPSAHNIVVTMLYGNSSISPFICAFQSSNYREGFKKILYGCIKCLPRQQVEEDQSVQRD